MLCKREPNHWTKGETLTFVDPLRFREVMHKLSVPALRACARTICACVPGRVFVCACAHASLSLSLPSPPSAPLRPLALSHTRSLCGHVSFCLRGCYAACKHGEYAQQPLLVRVELSTWTACWIPRAALHRMARCMSVAALRVLAGAAWVRVERAVNDRLATGARRHDAEHDRGDQPGVPGVLNRVLTGYSRRGAHRVLVWVYYSS